MNGIYKRLVRPILFKFDPETIHDFTINLLSKIGNSPVLCDAVRDFCSPEPLPIEVFGLKFPNPVGLAAGMDKDAVAAPVWEALGFGFIEVGAITYHPQSGNPKPRVFRVVKEEAIINRMGFNNSGAESTAKRVSEKKANQRWVKIPAGVNIGKSRIVPNEHAAEDYEKTFRLLWSLFDFFVVNVSSPNTPNLRLLQDKEELSKILTGLNKANTELANASLQSGEAKSCLNKNVRVKPILVKISPDLTFDAIEEVITLCKEQGVSGIVATNTTTSRPQSDDADVSKIYSQEGGLSGRPLKNRSTEIIKFIYKNTKGSLPIIGVGGMFTPQDVWEKITAGATLVQIYTGMIYNGPMIVKTIVNGLYEILEQQGIKNIADAVGMDVK